MTTVLETIFKKIDNDVALTKDDAISLLEIDITSPEFYFLLAKSNERSRKVFGDKGYIFAQIGLNAEKCSGNCKFCSLGCDNFSVECVSKPSNDELMEIVKGIDYTHLDCLFLMTTADYPVETFFSFARKVKAYIPTHVNLVANIGDFGDETAKTLKDIGFFGFYHICRLREGVDTALPLQQRIDTIKSGINQGLELFYCVEPIGIEHTNSEIADEMLRARDFGVKIMAVMGRTSVPNTPFANQPELDDLTITKIVAVTRLVTNPSKSMNVHEPKFTPLLAGVNQLYAEIGINPRDTKLKTENNRGFSIEKVRKMLDFVGYNT